MRCTALKGSAARRELFGICGSDAWRGASLVQAARGGTPREQNRWPLIVLLVLYPALYAVHLATLNKSMERFVGFGNFLFLFKRETFWMVVEQSCIFAISAVIFKALIGFFVAHFVHAIPAKGQRKWRGMLLVPWVIPPAMSTLAWFWLFDPSYSALNWLLERMSRMLWAWVSASSMLLPSKASRSSARILPAKFMMQMPMMSVLMEIPTL
mgnify:CR=1 FL=1